MKGVRFATALAVFLIFAGRLPLAAQDVAEKRALTLQEAVALALERNPQVLMAREQVPALEGKIREVRAEALPFFSLNSSALRWRDPAFLNSASFDEIPEEFRSALTVKGANLFDYNLRLTQPIYTSGKVGTALKIASLEAEGVTVDVARAEQELRLRVVRAFYDLLLSDRLLAVARQTVEQREQHLEMARRRFEAGVATEVDVLRSQVSLANAQPELLRAENEVRRARAVLNNLLVRPMGFPTEALGELVFDESARPELEEAALLAADRRPELQRLRLNERSTEQQRKLADAENRLRMDFSGQYGFSARLPEHLVNHNFKSWMFSVSLKLPLFDGGRRSGLVQQAVSMQRTARLMRIEAENNVRLEVQTALDELRRAERTVDAARLTVREAERVLEMMQNNYQYGAATTLDVTDAQTALALARTNLLRGLYDHTLARSQLRYAMGLDPVE
jgi:HAE1 family hydrophobic/amphiphilic exporter-1